MSGHRNGSCYSLAEARADALAARLSRGEVRLDALGLRLLEDIGLGGEVLEQVIDELVAGGRAELARRGAIVVLRSTSAVAA